MLPLVIDDVIQGAVGWSFRRRDITDELRGYTRRLAQMGGVALYRAGFFEAKRRERIRSEIARYRAMRQNLLMGELSAALDSSSDAADAATSLASVARLTVRILGEWCAIDTSDEHGRLQLVAAVHADPNSQSIRREYERNEAPRGRTLPSGLSDGRPALIPSLVDSSARAAGLHVRQVRVLRKLGLKRLLVVPLRIHGRTIDALSVASSDGAGTYSARDVALASRIGRLCAASLEYERCTASAERANQAREDFVATTSHELRMPISHIKGFVSSLRTADAVWDTATRNDFLAEIEHEADRLTGLVETLLDMSRIDSGGLDSTGWTAASPLALVHAGVDRLGISLGDHPLDVQVPADLPPVWVDPAQVERVIANLLDNAAKYSPPGQPIGAFGRPSGDYVSFRIEDRGLGVPPEHLDRIFEPFFRAPIGGHPAKPGSGLGLAICRSIIRSQNGRIWAELRPGGGAAFVFVLPIASTSRRI